MNRDEFLKDDIKLSITCIKVQQVGLDIRLLSYQLKLISREEFISAVRTAIQKIADEVIQLKPNDNTMESFATKLLELLQGRKTIELKEDELVALVEITELSSKIEILEVLKHSKSPDIDKEIEEARHTLQKIMKDKKILEVFSNQSFYPALFSLDR